VRVGGVNQKWAAKHSSCARINPSNPVLAPVFAYRDGRHPCLFHAMLMHPATGLAYD
jgi:hypothetical protein